MKEMRKTLLIITSFAFFVLLYVHSQISLIHISYLIDDRTEKLSRYSEEYRKLRFEVDQLKAPRILEEKIKSLSLDLTLPKEIRVIRTPAPLPAIIQEAPLPSAAGGRFFDFVGRWVNVAQAKTDN